MKFFHLAELRVVTQFVYSGDNAAYCSGKSCCDIRHWDEDGGYFELRVPKIFIF
jgi:hypothetical protein